MNTKGMKSSSELNRLSREVIGAAIEVHKELGPGLLESAYEACLCHELDIRGIEYERQLNVPVRYKGKELDCGYRIDILVNEALVIELKSCEGIQQIHRAQLLTYMKLLNLQMGLILNFNVHLMKEGIVRILNGWLEQE
jgi:GxxExxY protein